MEEEGACALARLCQYWWGGISIVIGLLHCRSTRCGQVLQGSGSGLFVPFSSSIQGPRIRSWWLYDAITSPCLLIIGRLDGGKVLVLIFVFSRTLWGWNYTLGSATQHFGHLVKVC